MLVGASIVVATAAVVPFEDRALGPTPSFVPALLAVVAVCDVLSVYLLVADFHDRGDRRLLALTAAYVWSLAMMSTYALAFPGAVAAPAPLSRTPSLAPWSYVLWHAGFPALLGAAWLPWPQRWRVAVSPVVRRRASRRTVGVAALLSVSAAFALVGGVQHLPVLIHGLDTSAMTRLTAPVALPMAFGALVTCWWGTRDRSGPERWSVVAVLACCCDLVLTYGSRHRFSAGWYGGRTLTLVAAGVVVVATIGALRHARGAAEQLALQDSLTGLANRRSAQRDLELLHGLARRGELDLSVLVLDIDHFKAVNDSYGHETGDRVLCEVAKVLSGTVRSSDLVARVGGEEFLVILPGADLQGAVRCAEALRSAVAQLQPPGLPSVTVSVGAASLVGEMAADDLVRQADGLLYAAKNAGRNRVEAAAQVLPVPAQRSGAASDRGVRGGT